MQPQTVQTPDPRVIESLKVIDKDGNPCPAYDRYKRGEVTVLCNQSGARLRLPLDTPSGIVWLDEGEFIDLEEVARPSAIDFSGINRLTTPGAKSGYVSFTLHKKGTEPVGKVKYEQVGPTADQNRFDERLDEREQKDIDEDERTSRRRSRRTGPQGTVTRAQSRGGKGSGEK